MTKSINYRLLYAEITRAEKAKAAQIRAALTDLAEVRLFRLFRKRAREDLRAGRSK